MVTRPGLHTHTLCATFFSIDAYRRWLHEFTMYCAIKVFFQPVKISILEIEILAYKWHLYKPLALLLMFHSSSQ